MTVSVPLAAETADSPPSGQRPSPHRAQQTAQLLQEAAQSPEPRRTQLQDRVIEMNLCVAHSIARRFRDRGEALSDLEQAASVGLIKAARHFDVGFATDFLTYAVPTITGEVKRHFRDCSWTVRPPRRVQELQAKVSAAWSELNAAQHRSPRPEQIAEHVGEPLPRVLEAMSSDGCFTAASLDEPVGDADGVPRHQLIGVEDGNYAAREAAVTLQPAIDQLSERDRHVLDLRVNQAWSQERIAGDLGVSQMQVSRMLSRIHGRLRQALACST